jgi:hypothetical protein
MFLEDANTGINNQNTDRVCIAVFGGSSKVSYKL